MARHIGNGIYVCADGIEREWDDPDQAPPCVGCEGEEHADGADGLCSFCREDGRPGLSAPPPKPLTDEQRGRLARIGAERRADIERRIAERTASSRAATQRAHGLG